MDLFTSFEKAGFEFIRVVNIKFYLFIYGIEMLDPCKKKFLDPITQKLYLYFFENERN